jgi:uncharacterized OB-fold protein
VVDTGISTGVANWTNTDSDPFPCEPLVPFPVSPEFCPERRKETHLAESGNAEAAQGEKKANPIVPHLQLPEAAGQKAYISGVKCKSCGAAYVGTRMACSKCFAVDDFEELRFSGQGTLRAFTIVYQTAPGIEVPFIAAIVDLPEGTAVRCNIGGVEPDGEKVAALLGKKLEMYTEKVRTDQEGNDVIAFKFRPAAT